MKLYGHTGQRMLRAEPLERRELLAADLWCSGAVLPPDTSQFTDVAIVQEQVPVVAAEVDDTQPRAREGDDDKETGDRVGTLKRPRDRDSQDDSEDVTVTASASVAVAAVDPIVDVDQPQERERFDVDDDTSPEEDAALKRPRDQKSQDAT